MYGAAQLHRPAAKQVVEEVRVPRRAAKAGSASRRQATSAAATVLIDARMVALIVALRQPSAAIDHLRHAVSALKFMSNP